MTTSGPITQDPDRRLLTHKDYAIKVIKSIIRDKDMDPCAEEMIEELGASGLFYLARVRFFLSIFNFFVIQWLTVILPCRNCFV